MASSQLWRSVSYGGGSYIAVAAGLVTAAASSTDGITWTTRTMPSAAWTASTYGNGLFVAVSTTSSAASSTDGITWTLRTMPANTLWYGVAYGNGVFASVSGNNITTAASSTDGITWTLRTAPAAFWYGVGFGNGVFVTVSQTTSSAAISTDGTTWTSVTMPASPTWYAITASTGGLTNESYLSISNTESYYLSAASSNIQNQINAKAINASPTLTNVNLSSVLNFTLSSPYSTNLQKFFGVTQQPIGSTTYTVSEYDRFLVFNTTAACTVTLPAAASFSGREITLKQIAAFAVNSASSNVQPLTSVTAGTAILTGAGKYAVLVSNGTNWIVVRSN
jgi:hypothetical protein